MCQKALCVMVVLFLFKRENTWERKKGNASDPTTVQGMPSLVSRAQPAHWLGNSGLLNWVRTLRMPDYILSVLIGSETRGPDNHRRDYCCLPHSIVLLKRPSVIRLNAFQCFCLVTKTTLTLT